MVKSNTSNILNAVSVTDIVNTGIANSMAQITRNAKQDSYRVDNAVAQFFDMFASVALDTAAAPSLGIYTPVYANLSSSYARNKPTGAGFFKKSGDLQRDVRSLTGQTTNLLGKSSFFIQQSSRGAKKGFTTTGTSVRSNKTGRFVSRPEGLRNFKVVIRHSPFSKVDENFKPRELERDIFSGAYEEIYAKLTNKQQRGKRDPYRPAFYSFMKWWLNVHLPEVLK